MASKYVRETKAARSISAYVVLKDGEHVATINGYHTEGACVVNVFDFKGKGFQYGRATGYGYDKENAALDGLEVQGVKIKEAYGVRTLESEGFTVINAI